MSAGKGDKRTRAMQKRKRVDSHTKRESEESGNGRMNLGLSVRVACDAFLASRGSAQPTIREIVDSKMGRRGVDRCSE